MPLTTEQRRQRARIAALTRWAKEEPTANAQRGQAGLLDRFRRQIATENPDLPAAELDRRAECARRAHMNRLSLASSKARGTTPLAASPPSSPPPQPERPAGPLTPPPPAGPKNEQPRPGDQNPPPKTEQPPKPPPPRMEHAA